MESHSWPHTFSTAVFAVLSWLKKLTLNLTINPTVNVKVNSEDDTFAGICCSLWTLFSCCLLWNDEAKANIKGVSLLWIDKVRAKKPIYCKTYIYWQTSNTAVHYAFISSGRGPPPDLFPLAGVPPRQTKIFFCGSWFSWWRNGWRPRSQVTGGRVWEHCRKCPRKGSRALQINISPTSGVLEHHRVGVHQVLNIGTGRRPRNNVWKLLWRWKGSSTPLRHGRLWLGWAVCIIHDIINYMIYVYTQSLSSSW